MDRKALYQYYKQNKMLDAKQFWTLATVKTNSKYFTSVAFARTTTTWENDMACIIEHPITKTRKLLVFTFDKTTMQGKLVFEMDLEQGYLVRPAIRDQTKGKSDFRIGKKKMVLLIEDGFWIGHGTDLEANQSYIIQRGEGRKFVAHPQKKE